MSLRGGRPERSECSSSAVEGSDEAISSKVERTHRWAKSRLTEDCFGLGFDAKRLNQQPSQRHRLMRLRHLRDATRRIGVVAFDLCQMAGKQLSGDDAH